MNRSRNNEGISLGPATFLLLFPSKKAIKVSTISYGIKTIPVSMIHDDSEIHERCEKEDQGDLVVKEWFAENNGYL